MARPSSVLVGRGTSLCWEEEGVDPCLLISVQRNRKRPVVRQDMVTWVPQRVCAGVDTYLDSGGDRAGAGEEEEVEMGMEITNRPTTV